MAVMKSEADGKHPANHYLVVEDPQSPTTWHLRFKDVNGTVDHRLMGACWAALHEGYRGNKYEGPGKDAALAKLKKLYASEDMPMPMKSLEDDDLISIGDDVRAIPSVPGAIGGYGLRFGNEHERDLVGTFFKATTNYGPGDGNGQSVTLNHCRPLRPELRELGQRFIGNGAHTEKDEIGIFVSTVLNLADKYEAWVYELAQKGKFKWSSGTAERLIRDDGKGGIENWPIIEWALTPIAAEPRLPNVTPLKSLPTTDLDLPDATVDDFDASESQDAEKPVKNKATNTKSLGDIEMDEKEMKTALAEMLPGLIKDAVKASAPAEKEGGFAGDPKDADESSVRSAAQRLQYSKLSDGEEAIMKQVYGASYIESVSTQTALFKKYLRRGDADMVRDEVRCLRQQLWPVSAVKDMLVNGLSVKEIRATMVEGADVLGGFAVPPQVAAETLSKVAGLTVVRAGGATVVQTASNLIEWLKVTDTVDSTSKRYPTGLRGAWGTEIQAPSSKNMTFGLLQIPVNLYTYYIPMSVSLIEDASNVVDLTMAAIANTLSVDEDDAFLRGDGANKPRGILPGATTAANTDSYTEANSGSAAVLTYTGLFTLRRAIASQYRTNGRSSLIGNSATGGVIEQMKNDLAISYFGALDSGVTKVLGMTWRESEAMDDQATNTYPLIHADLSGYAIVERLGMSIQRYNDSNTGPNVVQFAVRRRIGGRVIEPWKFAVQKCAA